MTEHDPRHGVVLRRWGSFVARREMGVALVPATVIDATLVRMLLVPATTSVLGSLDWWAPGHPRRLHARWGTTG